MAIWTIHFQVVWFYIIIWAKHLQLLSKDNVVDIFEIMLINFHQDVRISFDGIFKSEGGNQKCSKIDLEHFNAFTLGFQ